MKYQQKLLSEILQEHGQSLTKGRQLVVDILWEQPPMTIQQIMNKVDGRIDRASLYRTITLFEQLGIIQKVAVGWKYTLELTGPFSGHHHHLTCLNCHQTIAIVDPAIEKRLVSIGQQHNFDIQYHQIELQGYCSKCQKLDGKRKTGD